MFSLINFNPHNSNGGWSLVIRQNNPNGTKLNKDQHEGKFWEVQDLPNAQGAYNYSIVQDGSHADCEACFQDWYLENGTWLSHGILGRAQGFLFIFNELEGWGARCFFTQRNMGWTSGCWEWEIWEGVMRRPRLGALL